MPASIAVAQGVPIESGLVRHSEIPQSLRLRQFEAAGLEPAARCAFC
jgi:hypothetical protein